MLMLLFLFSLFRAGESACACQYPYQTFTSPGTSSGQYYILNPADDVTWALCKMNCTFILDSSDPKKGFTNFVQSPGGSWDNDGGANLISIFNLRDDNTTDPDPLAYNLNYTNTNYSFTSSSSRIIVYLTMTENANIFGTIYRSESLPTPPPPITTATTGPPTTPYVGPYPVNPALISHDIIFTLDSGRNTGGALSFNASKQLAIAIVNSFDGIVVGNASDKSTPVTGSRLGVKNLSPLNAGYPETPWHLDKQSAVAALQSTQPVAYPSSYVTNLNTLFNILGQNPFSINNSNVSGGIPMMDSRPHAQRTLFIVASSAPNDIDALTGDKDLNSSFTQFDVHVVYVGYNLTEKDLMAVDSLKTIGWAVEKVFDLNSTTVQEIVKRNLLSADSICGNYDQNIIADNFPTNSTPGTLQLPNNFIIPDLSKTFWTPSPQTARYCNFQNVKYTFEYPGNNKAICFQVIYELETEKDKLSFWDGDGVEVVSLTGVDIDGTHFRINSSVTAIFTSNWSQVFGGYQIKYWSCP